MEFSYLLLYFNSDSSYSCFRQIDNQSHKVLFTASAAFLEVTVRN